MNLGFLKWSFCGLMLVGVLNSANTSAFNEKTHRNVTTSAYNAAVDLKEVYKDNADAVKVSEFFKGDIKYAKVLEDYSNMPDIDENQGAYKYHFYNPITEKNFMNEPESALAKCKEHFQNAVQYYKSKNKQMAYQELGRAIHFLEDCNTPVHTAYETPMDSVVKLSLHVAFEKVCDSVCEDCSTKINLQSLEYFNLNSIDTIVRSGAILAADNFFYLEDTNDHAIKPQIVTLARNAVKNAKEKVFGIYCKFYKEVLKK